MNKNKSQDLSENLFMTEINQHMRLRSQKYNNYKIDKHKGPK